MTPYKWLWPLSLIYQLITNIRRGLYKLGIFKTHYFPVPIIIVGNITAGGTGKTPLVIYLAQLLKQHGYNPGLVSRGYKGKSSYYPIFVRQDSCPTLVGDEPLLLHRRTGCPIVVDPKRPRAVAALLAETNCNVIISDDGLQHYALGRHLEIAVIDGEKRLGNQLCLPAGLLREPKKRLNTVDFIVTNGNAQVGEWSMHLLPDKLHSIKQPYRTVHFDYFKGKIVQAIAGIGNPKRFFNTLDQLGFTVIPHPFPDHYPFKSTDFRDKSGATFILTEKDAVKCENFADDRFWCLTVSAQLEAAFDQKILARLKLIKRKLK